MKPMLRMLTASLLGWAIFAPNVVLAQVAEPFAYPSEGQSPEQQQKDHDACYGWARRQSGISPSTLSPQTIAQSSGRSGVVRGAARGSVLGVVGGAISSNNTVGQGAAVGAGVGALAGLMRRVDDQQSVDQVAAQVNAQEQQQLERFYQAWTACMEGRGYTVR
ncbi:MAG: YMGG-like glycine zipper-containing protein [Microcystaceae cyanobacterium]